MKLTKAAQQWVLAKQAERDARQDCPNGRTMITGEVLVHELYDYKHYLILDDRGFRIFGPVAPTEHDVKTGDRVSFTATVVPNPNDLKFGYYSQSEKWCNETRCGFVGMTDVMRKQIHENE